MTISDTIKAYFTRKRSLKFVVAGILLVLVGQLLDSLAVATLQAMTTSVETSLRSIQPFEIADIFGRAASGRSGLWFCAPVGSLGDEDHCGGIIGLANIGLASTFAIPEVTGEVWANGGSISTILFVVTLLAMGLLIVAGWQGSNDPDGSVGRAFLGTIAVLALGPFAAGAVFWLMLQFLLVLIVIFGKALAGVTWCVATFGTAYKVCALVFGAVDSGDKLQQGAAILTGDEKKRED